MDGDRSDCIRFYEFVKIALTVSNPVSAETHERKAPALRTPLVQSLNTEAGDLGDLVHGEKAI